MAEATGVIVEAIRGVFSWFETGLGQYVLVLSLIGWAFQIVYRFFRQRPLRREYGSSYDYDPYLGRGRLMDRR